MNACVCVCRAIEKQPKASEYNIENSKLAFRLDFVAVIENPIRRMRSQWQSRQMKNEKNKKENSSVRPGPKEQTNERYTQNRRFAKNIRIFAVAC